MRIDNTNITELIINGGDSMTIGVGAIVKNAVIYPNGCLWLTDGGSASVVEIHSGGSVGVHSSGSVGTAIVSSQGLLRVWSTGEASSVVLHGGQLMINNGGKATLTEFKYGSLEKNPEGILEFKLPTKNTSQARPSSYTCDVHYNGFSHHLDSGCLCSNATLEEGARLRVERGAIVDECTMSASTSLLVDGECDKVTVSAKAHLCINGVGNGLHILSGGTARLQGDAYARNTIIESGGSMILTNSARATTVYVCGGGHLELCDNSVVQYSQISPLGLATVRDNSDLFIVPNDEQSQGRVEKDAQETCRIVWISDKEELKKAHAFLNELEDIET